MIKVYNKDGELQYFDINNIYDSNKDTSLSDSLYDYFYIKATGARGVKIEFLGALNHLSEISLQYKIGNTIWQNYNVGEYDAENEEYVVEPETVEIDPGQVVYFRGASDRITFGEEENNNDDLEHSSFSLYRGDNGTGNKFNVEIGGNISSLVNFRTKSLSYDFYKLFQSCTAIESSSKLILPFETLAPHCYQSMFEGCSQMIDSPKMLAVTLAEECCRQMFKGCSKLEYPTELNSTVMAPGCYHSMFQDCTHLLTFPTLSSVILADSCYHNMFMGCTSMVTAPKLPATNLANLCYGGMFHGCTSLTTPPQLPATTMKRGCYSDMFYGCTSLVTPPELPATTLDIECYWNMFASCTSLVAAPKLPATTLTQWCYRWMFWGCSSLVKAPELPAEVLVGGCYFDMFASCSSLKLVKASFIEPVKMYIRHWLDGTSSKGALIRPENDPDWSNDLLQLPQGWVVVKEKKDDNIIKYLTFTVLTEGTITFTGEHGVAAFSVDEGENWSTLESSFTLQFSETPEEGVSYPIGQRVLWKGELSKSEEEELTANRFGKFSGTADFSAEGNIMSLVCGDNFQEELDLEDKVGGKETFYQLFSDSDIVNAENLVLPSLFLTVGCYKEMFSSCVTLLKAPKILPAMFLQEYCYQMMFKGCQILKTAPKLPAIDMEIGCYEEMFNQCYCLKEAPELPAKELKKICYRQMFSSCNNLKSIKADFLTAPVPFSHDDETDETTGGYTENWVSGVAPTGTFIYNDNFVDVERSVDCVPEGWLMLKKSQEKFITEDYKNIWRTYGGFSAHPVPTNSYFENQPHYYQIGKITPCDTTKSGKIKYHVLSFSQSDNSYLLDSIIEVSFGKNGEFKEYSVQNTLQENDHQPINYHVLYNDTEGGDIYIGVYHYNGTTSSQEGRVPNVIVKIDIVSCENCVISFGDLNILGFHAETNPLVSGIVNDTIKIINIPVFTGTHKSNYLIEATSENISLLPNQVYNFGVISNATITLEGSNNPANAYQFFFTAESDQTSITLPSNVHFVNGFDWQIVANRKYQVYIINGMAVVNYI